MAKNTPARVAVTATGVALLAMVAASTVPAEGSMYLTEAEGAEIVASGFATVDPATAQPDGTAAVTLTDAGRAQLSGGDQPKPAGSATFVIDKDVPPPVGNAPRRGRQSNYPFGSLEIGDSFHVPKKDEKDDVAARLASSVSGARAEFAEPTGEYVDKVKKTYQKEADGKTFSTGEDGKRIVKSTENVRTAVTRMTRNFEVRNVGNDDPRGAGARVWRIAVTEAAQAAENGNGGDNGGE